MKDIGYEEARKLTVARRLPLKNWTLRSLSAEPKLTPVLDGLKSGIYACEYVARFKQDVWS